MRAQAHNWFRGLCLEPARDALFRTMPASAAHIASLLRPPPPMQVINHHSHFSPGAQWIHAPLYSGQNSLQMRIGRKIDLSHKLRLIKSWCGEFHIQKALVMTEQGGYFDARKNKMAMSEQEANEEIGWLFSKLPELIVPIATGHPGHGNPDLVEPFLQRGFKGIKLHPHQLLRPADSREYDPYMELAGRYQVPVQVHSGLSDFAAPERILRLSGRFPQVPVVMIHTVINPDGTAPAGQIKKTLHQVARAIDHGQAVYVDLSCHSSRNYPISEALNLLGPDRIIFGTDGNIDDPCWFFKASGRMTSLYEAVMESGGTSAAEKIFHLNVERLYRLHEQMTRS